MGSALDPFDIPVAARPYWMSYRWVRKTLYGVEDKFGLDRAAEAGWRPVPLVRHGDLATANRWKKDTEFIEYGGMILMERPDHLSLAFEANERKKAFETNLHGGRPYHGAGAFAPRGPVNASTLPRATLWRRLKQAVFPQQEG